MIKKLNNKPKAILACALGTVIVAILTVLLANHFSKLNEKERELLNDFTNNALVYLDEYDIEDIESHPDETTRLVAFAAAYNYGQNGSLESKAEDLNTIANKIFKKEIKENDLLSASTNIYLMDKGFDYSTSEGALVLNQDIFNKKKVAKIPLYFYQEKKATARGGKIIVKYEKFKISNPYDILNYAATNQIDVPELGNYLEGRASYANIKRSVKNEDISNIGERVKDVKITYKIEGDSLYIDRIE